jgi:hypothetical protein
MSLRVRISALRAAGILLISLAACPGIVATADELRKPTQSELPVALIRKAEQGDAGAQRALGMSYFEGRQVDRDYALAAMWLRKAAGHGDAAAQVSLGYLLEGGLGVAQDETEAAKWYARAAASGLASGQLNLGIMYLNGTGVPQDDSVAFQLFVSAANKGNDYAQVYLGDLYLWGRGVTADMRQAEKLFESAGRRRNGLALYNLGILYTRTPGHEHNDLRAADYLKRAIDTGYTPATHELGLLLLLRRELEPSYGSGMHYLREAAEDRNWKSAAVLGVMYRDDKYGSANPGESYLWFRISAIAGGKPAEDAVKSSLVFLAPKLSETQRAALDRKAEQWVRAHPKRPAAPADEQEFVRLLGDEAGK